MRPDTTPRAARRVFLALLVGWLLGSLVRAASLDESVSQTAWTIVSRQTGFFTAPPILLPTRKIPDGPLLGNGDLGVAVGGVAERLKYFGLGEPGGANVTVRSISPTNCPERQRFWISKNDFWKTKSVYPNSHPAPIGGIDVTIPALVNGQYRAEQILATAEVHQMLTTAARVEDPPPFTRAGARIHLRSWVAATENLLVIELSVEGSPTNQSPFTDTDLVGVDVLQNDVRDWPEREWINHFNGFSQTFPGAVRVGHDPEDMLAKLRQQLTEGGFPNLLVFRGGGGIENCSAVPATINEMLLQTKK